MTVAAQLANLPAAATPRAEDDPVRWIERALPSVLRSLLDVGPADAPIMQLPVAQLRLVQILYRDGEPSEDAGETMSSLSERLGVRHNALTQAADRLIHTGLAERVGDPNDRRIVRLRLTSTGREWVAERRALRVCRLRRLWDALDGAERLALIESVRTLERAAQRLQACDGGAAVEKAGSA